VTLIAAKQGVGKTAVGMQLGNSIAESLDGVCLFTSLEMPSPAIFYRIARIEASCDEAVRDLENEEFTNMLMEDDELCDKISAKWGHLKIVDRAGLTIEQVEAYGNRVKDSGQDLSCILIDYIALLGGTGDYKGLSDTAREAKNMAKRLNTRVIILVQLSRKAIEGTRPTMDALRDSGSIGEAADICLMLWLSQRDSSILKCEFQKNRDDTRNRKFHLRQTGLMYKEEEWVEDDETESSGGNSSFKWKR